MPPPTCHEKNAARFARAKNHHWLKYCINMCFTVIFTFRLLQEHFSFTPSLLLTGKNYTIISDSTHFISFAQCCRDYNCNFSSPEEDNKKMDSSKTDRHYHFQSVELVLFLNVYSKIKKRKRKLGTLGCMQLGVRCLAQGSQLWATSPTL